MLERMPVLRELDLNLEGLDQDGLAKIRSVAETSRCPDGVRYVRLAGICDPTEFLTAYLTDTVEALEIEVKHPFAPSRSFHDSVPARAEHVGHQLCRFGNLKRLSIQIMPNQRGYHGLEWLKEFARNAMSLHTLTIKGTTNILDLSSVPENAVSVPRSCLCAFGTLCILQTDQITIFLTTIKEFPALKFLAITLDDAYVWTRAMGYEHWLDVGTWQVEQWLRIKLISRLFDTEEIAKLEEVCILGSWPSYHCWFRDRRGRLVMKDCTAKRPGIDVSWPCSLRKCFR